MTTLNLGVIDLHYADAGADSHTTGDVAEILEAEYGVMETFWGKYGQEVGDEMAQAYVGALEALHAGHVMRDPLGQVTTGIERRFKQFLTNKEMDGLRPGVPTQASLDGKSKRFKKQNKKRGPRPSFVDSGLYRSSFKTWFDHNG